MLFRVLGPLEVHGRDGEVHRLGHGKAATVLATLLLHPNAWVSGAELIDATWHEAAAPPASAEANLKTYVWRLRRLLPVLVSDDGEPRIESAPGRYRLRLAPGELDAHQAAGHAAAARSAVEAGELTTAVGAFEAALGLWRGQPFEGVAGADYEAARLVELRHQLREELAEAQLALGRTAEAVHTLKALTEDDPLREGPWASLVRALHALGRRAEALRAYDRARHVLAAELRVRPGRALTAAYREASGEPCAPRRELPRDPAHFTARSAELATIRRARGGVVLVDGLPGVGKTALAVHAAHGLAEEFPDGQFFVDLRAYRDVTGVLARLLRGIGTPGTGSSTEELAALLRSELAGRRVLLVLDHVESGDQVEPLLPSGDSSLTLVTTRHRDWHVDGAVRIGLRPLADRDAAAFFRAAAPDAFAREDVTASVVRRCGGIPAALRDVAAKLHTRPEWTPHALTRELRTGPCGVLSFGHRHALASAFAELPPALRGALSALGELPGEFALTTAARALGGTPEAVRPTLEALVDVSLLDALPGERYRGHRLVRHYARCRTCAPGLGTPAVRVA
ncbi:AfsR/SARP family transcriptional regulator [Prauserella flavalba]|uniref:AfsR/SARP family transcriptional regulator n=1 Tax=Prauserella flavalba TaxID=1477506 RepID=UPI0036E59C0D